MKYCNNDCDQGRRCPGCAGLSDSVDRTLTQLAWGLTVVGIMLCLAVYIPVLIDIYRTAAEAGAKAAGY